jgi:hypothetical protein
MARRKKSSSVKVNFKGVESRQTPPEGDYAVKVLELTTGQSAAKNDQIEGVFEISRGQYKGVKLYMYFPLQENSLWKLHAFLTALGEEVPEDEMDIDLSDLVDKELVGVITHETYNGRKRAKMTDFDSIDNYEGADDEKAGKKGGKGKKGKSKDEPEKISRSDVEDMDEDELEALVDEHDLTDDDGDDLDLDDFKKLPKKVEAVIEALERADMLEEEKSSKGKKGKKSKDDDEDEDKSSKKSKKDKGGKKKPKKIDRDDVGDMDEDALQELIDEHDLDVDLDDHKKIGKKREAVIEALDDEDLLEDE